MGVDSESKRLFEAVRSFVCAYLPSQRVASDYTAKAYRESLNLMLTFSAEHGSKPMGSLTFDDFGRDGIGAFLSWLAGERGCSAATCNCRLAAIRSFLRYASERNPVLTDLWLESRQG